MSEPTVMENVAVKEILVYDPKRRPPDWPGSLAVTEVAVFLSHCESGVPLNISGEIAGPASGNTCYVLLDLAIARQYCEALVRRFPEMRCEVFDRRGRVAEPLAVVVHPSKKAAEEDSPFRAKLLILGGGLAALTSVPLIYIDYRHSEQLIWPTLIAINLIAVALRLVYWGGAILERRKRTHRTSPNI